MQTSLRVLRFGFSILVTAAIRGLCNVFGGLLRVSWGLLIIAFSPLLTLLGLGVLVAGLGRGETTDEVLETLLMEGEEVMMKRRLVNSVQILRI